MICNLCPRRCGALRDEAHGEGFCGVGSLPLVSRAAPHMWEEPCLSGTKGSGTVFFSGCSLGCVFCQNERISRHPLGKTMDAAELSRLFRRVEESGVHNVNLVTPTHFWPVILEALKLYKPRIPVVWNSGGYELPEMVRALRGYVDIFLPDLKYASERTARELASAPDYFPVALEAVRTMCEVSGPPVYDDDGMMLSGTLIRHLVLPLRTNESIAILDAIARELPPGTPVSLMRQYTPLRDTGIDGLDRPLTAREYRKTVEHMLSLNLPGYTQSGKAVESSFIPAFMDADSTRWFDKETPAAE